VIIASRGILPILTRLIAQNPIHRGPTNSKPHGDLGGCHPSRLEPDDFVCSSPHCRCTTLVFAFSLSPCDAFALAFQHGLTLCLTDRTNNCQHQPSRCRGCVQGLGARHAENPQTDLFGFKQGDNTQQVAD
jgi:hypothetical protein